MEDVLTCHVGEEENRGKEGEVPHCAVCVSPVLSFSSPRSYIPRHQIIITSRYLRQSN